MMKVVMVTQKQLKRPSGIGNWYDLCTDHTLELEFDRAMVRGTGIQDQIPRSDNGAT